MAEPIYTHNFEMEFGDFEMGGECEFNVDGEASFKTTDPLLNLTVDQMAKLQRIFKTAREAFIEFGYQMKRIKIEEK